MQKAADACECNIEACLLSPLLPVSPWASAIAFAMPFVEAHSGSSLLPQYVCLIQNHPAGREQPVVNVTRVILLVFDDRLAHDDDLDAQHVRSLCHTYSP
jgi:hypothetical protein